MEQVTTNTQKEQHTEQDQPGKRPPISTPGVLIITTLVTGAQFINPAVLAALRRDPAALGRGDWWRMLTPLLVHDGGVWHFLYVALGIAVVGFVAEHIYRSWRWLLLYMLAGVTGEIAGYAWDPHGAGASVALCGLIGSILVWQLWQKKLASKVASLYIVAFVGALSGTAIAGGIVGIVLCSVAASTLFWLPNLKVSTRILASYIGIFGLLGALILTWLHDIHGPAILAGAGIAALLIWLDTGLRRTYTQA